MIQTSLGILFQCTLKFVDALRGFRSIIKKKRLFHNDEGRVHVVDQLYCIVFYVESWEKPNYDRSDSLSTSCFTWQLVLVEKFRGIDNTFHGKYAGEIREMSFLGDTIINLTY